jgi:hypothetical protein
VQGRTAALKEELDMERHEHSRIVSAIKADTRRLLQENEEYASRLRHLADAHDSAAEARARQDAERDGVVRDLMAHVQKQATQLRDLQARHPGAVSS